MKGTFHDHHVSVRELAALLQVSTDTIRRAYRRGDLPAIRVKTALRFDLEEVHRVMQRQAEAYRSAQRCAASGARRVPIEPQPRLVKRGRYFQTTIHESSQAYRPKSCSFESTPIGKCTAWQPEPATLLPLRQGVVAPPATKAGSVSRLQEPILGQASASEARRHPFERTGEQRGTPQQPRSDTHQGLGTRGPPRTSQRPLPGTCADRAQGDESRWPNLAGDGRPAGTGIWGHTGERPTEGTRSITIRGLLKKACAACGGRTMAQTISPKVFEERLHVRHSP